MRWGWWTQSYWFIDIRIQKFYLTSNTPSHSNTKVEESKKAICCACLLFTNSIFFLIFSPDDDILFVLVSNYLRFVCRWPSVLQFRLHLLSTEWFQDSCKHANKQSGATVRARHCVDRIVQELKKAIQMSPVVVVVAYFLLTASPDRSIHAENTRLNWTQDTLILLLIFRFYSCNLTDNLVYSRYLALSLSTSLLLTSSLFTSLGLVFS